MGFSTPELYAVPACSEVLFLESSQDGRMEKSSDEIYWPSITPFSLNHRLIRVYNCTGWSEFLFNFPLFDVLIQRGVQRLNTRVIENQTENVIAKLT